MDHSVSKLITDHWDSLTQEPELWIGEFSESVISVEFLSLKAVIWTHEVDHWISELNFRIGLVWFINESFRISLPTCFHIIKANEHQSMNTTKKLYKSNVKLVHMNRALYSKSEVILFCDEQTEISSFTDNLPILWTMLSKVNRSLNQ